MGQTNDHGDVMAVLEEAKRVARAYRRLTGKPLGVTGEVAEFEAARILSLRLAEARQAGYDATETTNGEKRRLQIKGRCLPPNHKSGERIGALDIDKEWDAALLVLLDENLEAYAIHEAAREAVVKAIQVPGSKARNERRALSVSKFKAIGHPRWIAEAA